MDLQEKSKLHLRSLLLSILFAVFTNFLVADYFQDDAYISFHYADNLVDHGTLYYNVGETGPVGYSNPLYVFLLAALRLLSFKLIPFEVLARGIASISLIMIVFTVLNSIAQDRLSDSLSRGALVFLSLFLILVFPYQLPSFFCGLETPLLALLLFIIFSHFLSGHPKNNSPFLVAMAMALTVRIDAIPILFPVVLATPFILNAKGLRLTTRSVVLTLAFVAAVYLFQFAMAGSLVPLSYGHKKEAFNSTVLFAYLKYFVLCVGPLVIILSRPKRRLPLILLCLYGVYVCIFYSFFEQWHFNRYVFPFAFAAFAALLNQALLARRETGMKPLLLLGLFALIAYSPGARSGYSWVSGYRVSTVLIQKIGTALNNSAVEQPHRLLGAYDAGYYAYATDWRFLDLQGLATPEALTRDIGAVVQELQPAVLLMSNATLVKPTLQRIWSPFQDEPSPMPKNYKFVKRIALTNKYWWRLVPYSYSIFVNEHATEALTAELSKISINVEKEMGYQIRIYEAFRSVTSWI